MKVDVHDDEFVVDVAVLAGLLDLPASEIQALMRGGRITSICEKGLREHHDQFRLTFFHGNRRACISVDRSGRILTRSIIDFGSKSMSRASYSRPQPDPGQRASASTAAHFDDEQDIP